MTRITVTRDIAAPVHQVFATVADIRKFSEAIPHVVRYEFLSDQQSGQGTRFRETRLMNGKEMQTELEITEYVENERARMVADSHGTIWDTLYTVAGDADGGSTTLTLTMDARAHKLLPRLLNPLVKGLIQKGVAKDMDLVKSFLEQAGPV